MMYIRGNRSTCRMLDPPNEVMEVVSCPSPLYRYLPTEFAGEFLHRGRIRIMPLCHYRDTLDSSRADEDEGDKVHRVPDGPVDGRELGPLYIGAPVLAEDNTITFTPPPSFCLCFSAVASRELAQRFSDPPGRVATCIRMGNPKDFLIRVDREFRTAAQSYDLRVIRSFGAPVRYKTGSMTDWPKAQIPYDPRLIKERARYAVEAEYRAVWSVAARSTPAVDPSLEKVSLTIRPSEDDLTTVEWADLPPRVTAEVSVIS